MNGNQKVLDLLANTAGLPATQRLILVLYAVHPSDRSGTVMEMGRDLAKLVDLSPTVFSRTRKQLIDDGWLEETEKLGHIRYYRLSPKATGEQVIVPLVRQA